MKKIFSICLLLIGMVSRLAGQNFPILNVPSPEIANLGQYGTIPVSLFTGVPDISIPLYEVRTGNYSLPISVSYHLASVKPNSQPGCLGMGWSLIAGGYITRTVRGMYDEQCQSNGYAPGFYAHASKMKGITPEQFRERTLQDSQSASDYYELCADEFSFSFCGYSGNFYYNENGGWSVVSDQPIQVEFNPQMGEGFINLAQLNNRIDTQGWNRRSYNNRFFNKFTLITPDGCRYEFGGLDATEFSIPYYARNTSDLIPTTWRLTKITTVEGRTIEFTYDSSSISCDLQYIPQQKVVTGLPCSNQNPQVGKAGMSGYLLFPVYLKSIKTSDETLELNYYKDVNYATRFPNMAIGWTEANYIRENIYSNNLEDPANQFQVFLKNVGNKTDSDYLETIRQNLSVCVLHSIGIKRQSSGGHSRTIYFDYTLDNRRKLSRITEREGFLAPIPDYVKGNGIIVMKGYKIPGNVSTNDMPEYKFAYHTTYKIPASYVLPATDSWGYYRGTNVNLQGADFELHIPTLEYTMADVLEEITYPTGGKSRFTYQLNRYSKVVNEALTSLRSASGNAGGLRISSVTHTDRNGKTLGIKKYYYAESKSTNAPSSGILRRMPTNMVSYTTTSGQKLSLLSAAGFFPSVTNLNSPDVGYSCVIEETLDSIGESQGYVRYRYSNYDADIYGQTHLDEPAIYSMISGEGYAKPYTSRSAERGKLLSEEYFDKNNRLRRKTAYTYKEVNTRSLLTAYQTYIAFCSDIALHASTTAGMLTKTYLHSFLKSTVADTVYADTGTGYHCSMQTYSYDDTYKLLKKHTIKNSEGDDYTTAYTHPTDYPEYQWMTRLNILEPTVEKQMIKNTTPLREERIYYGSKGSVPYPRQKVIKRQGILLRTDFQVTAVDKYGNPVEITEKGLTSVLIWGYEGQKLIARIDNATREQVKELLGTDPVLLSEQTGYGVIYSQLANIRHKLPSAHFRIYKYNSNLLLESATLPNGETTFYSYDYAGRLREVFISEKVNGQNTKKIVNRYDYHYQNNDRGGTDPDLPFLPVDPIEPIL